MLYGTFLHQRMFLRFSCENCCCRKKTPCRSFHCLFRFYIKTCWGESHSRSDPARINRSWLVHHMPARDFCWRCLVSAFQPSHISLTRHQHFYGDIAVSFCLFSFFSVQSSSSPPHFLCVFVCYCFRSKNLVATCLDCSSAVYHSCFLFLRFPDLFLFSFCESKNVRLIACWKPCDECIWLFVFLPFLCLRYFRSEKPVTDLREGQCFQVN